MTPIRSTYGRRPSGKPPRRASDHEAGYTLLELVTVLVVLAVITSAIVPMFYDSMRNIRRDGAVENFIATMKHAHERAVLNATEFRVYLNVDENSYWVEALFKEEPDKAPAFVSLPEVAGRVHVLPEGVEFERPKAQQDKERNLYYIRFFPGGACDVATVSLRIQDTARPRHVVTVTTEGRLGQFKVKGLD